MKDSLQSLLKKEADNLIVFSRDFLSYKRCVLVLGVVSLLYILVILFYTHGALLFNGNYGGFYHLQASLLNTPNGVLQAISLLISMGDIYVAYYIYLYLSILSLTIASFYLSLQILSKFIPSDELKIYSLIAASLSFVEPFVLNNYYSTLTGNGYIVIGLLYTSFFVLFLAFLFRSYSFRHNNQNSKPIREGSK